MTQACWSLFRLTISVTSLEMVELLLYYLLDITFVAYNEQKAFHETMFLEFNFPNTWKYHIYLG
jgi:hypothetical protein